VDDAPGWLASGKADAAVGNLPTICDVTRNAHLFDEHYVRLVREEHPVSRATLTREAFVAVRHAFVSSSFFGHKQVENLLRQLGVKVALQIRYFTILSHLISNSDLGVVLPSPVADLFNSQGGLQNLPMDARAGAGGGTARLEWRDYACRKVSA
jgi:DNA-binding transcriptional LysR family regulator